MKQHLLLVLGGVATLVLLAFSSYFLFNTMQKEAGVTIALADQSTELDRLLRLDPQPTPANIEVVQNHEKELMAFVEKAQRTFVPLAYPTNLDSGQFKLQLLTTVDELTRHAQRSGVKMHAGYAFTFSGQKTLMTFDSKNIEPLSKALTEIAEVVQVLFDSRILSLDGIRRITIASQDTPSPDATAGQAEFWTRKTATNDLAYLVPYEFTFHCFTPELLTVLQGLAANRHCFLIKSLTVDTTPSSLLSTNTATPEGGAVSVSTSPGGMSAAMMARYGLRGRRPGAMPMPGEETPSQPTGPTTTRRGGLDIILEEKPFRVVMRVDAVRLRDRTEVQASTRGSRSMKSEVTSREDGSSQAVDSGADPVAQ
ncbi:MAG: hypothetical protein ACYDC1_12450 [Limisphaerales bacterium]